MMGPVYPSSTPCAAECATQRPTLLNSPLCVCVRHTDSETGPRLLLLSIFILLDTECNSVFLHVLTLARGSLSAFAAISTRLK